MTKRMKRVINRMIKRAIKRKRVCNECKENKI